MRITNRQVVRERERGLREKKERDQRGGLEREKSLFVIMKYVCEIKVRENKKTMKERL